MCLNKKPNVMIYTQKIKDEIEAFFNEGKKPDVEYVFFRNVPETLKKDIYNILEYKKKQSEIVLKSKINDKLKK